MEMRTTSATGSSRRGAFTLIELSIVVFILAMMLAASAPYFVRTYNSAVLRETARTFATTCQFARIQAVSRQQPAVLHIDLGRQMFWVTQSVPNEDGVEESQTLKVHQLSGRVWLMVAERYDLEGRDDKVVDVTFYPNGTCDGVMLLLRGVEKKDALATTIDPITARAVTTVAKL